MISFVNAVYHEKAIFGRDQVSGIRSFHAYSILFFPSHSHSAIGDDGPG
jgi:hypothetical protein